MGEDRSMMRRRGSPQKKKTHLGRPYISTQFKTSIYLSIIKEKKTYISGLHSLQ